MNSGRPREWKRYWATVSPAIEDNVSISHVVGARILSTTFGKLYLRWLCFFSLSLRGPLSYRMGTRLKKNTFFLLSLLSSHLVAMIWLLIRRRIRTNHIKLRCLYHWSFQTGCARINSLRNKCVRVDFLGLQPNEKRTQIWMNEMTRNTYTDRRRNR